MKISSLWCSPSELLRVEKITAIVRSAHGYWLALTAGALLPFAFAPFSLELFAFLAPALLFLLWSQVTPRRALAYGFIFGIGQFGVGASWIYISIMQFGGVGLPLALIATVLFILFMALYPASAGFLATQIVNRGSPSRIVFVFPAVWVLFEWLRGWFLGGFPWLDLGSSQLDMPLAGFVPIFGIYGASFLASFSAVTLVTLLISGIRFRYSLVGIVLMIWAGGGWLTMFEWTKPDGSPIKVSLIQGNVPQDQKWLSSKRWETLQLYYKLTRRHWDSDLIVWPETAVPAYLHQVSDGYLHPLREEAIENGTEILLGVPYKDVATQQYFNSMVSLGQISGRYDKRHLVPFGEYIPVKTALGSVFDFLEIPMADFAAGDKDQPLLQLVNFPVGISICYEDVFGREVRRALPEAAFLVNASNDAWFGDSLAPHQHLEIARVRALETGRYLVRATNTGISAFIGPHGEVLSKSPQFRVYVLTAKVVPLAGSTPYVSFGDWPVMLLLIGSLTLLTILQKMPAEQRKVT